MDDSSSSTTHSNATYQKLTSWNWRTNRQRRRIKNSMWKFEIPITQTNMINYWRSARMLSSGCPHVSPEWMPCCCDSWSFNKHFVTNAMSIGTSLPRSTHGCRHECGTKRANTQFICDVWKTASSFWPCESWERENFLSLIYRPNSIFSRVQNFHSPSDPVCFHLSTIWR